LCFLLVENWLFGQHPFSGKTVAFFNFKPNWNLQQYTDSTQSKLLPTLSFQTLNYKYPTKSFKKKVIYDELRKRCCT
jgi:hypothetical protein